MLFSNESRLVANLSADRKSTKGVGLFDVHCLEYHVGNATIRSFNMLNRLVLSRKLWLVRIGASERFIEL
jgi:hypothetical protein